MSTDPEKAATASSTVREEWRLSQADTVIVAAPAPTPKVAPDGGLHAWLMALAGFANLLCTFGFLNSFGVFQLYYQTHFLNARSPSEISWIGSLQICFLYLGGIVSGPLADRYGIRAVLVPSSVVLTFSIMMTSLATQYYQFILAHGILFGLSCGMLWTPTLSTVGQYFTSHRSLATGVVVSGASIGGIIFPIMLDRLLNSTGLGFGWTVRIIGFIMLAILAFSSTAMKEFAPRRKHKLFLPAAFRSKPYSFLVVGFFLCNLGFWTPIFYIAEYSRLRGVASSLVFYEVAILNAASFFGRIAPNFVADKLGRFNMNLVMTLITAILLFCWTAATSAPAITVFVALYGFSQGALVSMFPPCFAQITPVPSDIGTYVGMALASCSLAGLAGTPINGALISRFDYISASTFSAAMVLAGAVCYLMAKLAVDRRMFVRV